MIIIQIVEDHKLVADSLSPRINESGRVLVTGTYYNLQSCREGLANSIPDILLLDIDLPDGNGVDFCVEAKKRYPVLKIIMLTGYKEFNIVKHALHNGASGYILKNAEIEEMLAGIEIVNSGEQFLCEEIDVLLKDKKNEPVIWLTDCEKVVLDYISKGYTRKEIADLRCRDEETIKTHWRNLLVKFNAKNTAELVKKACDMNFLQQTKQG
ncbi:MAG: response regulator transcription factor [Dysgonamonadaceae bacterium]|jgi:DNA-binding NarL/FixJ family response regulator|nr:response regulator transcription factor [Dysgonamonadaceae bacterium]